MAITKRIKDAANDLETAQAHADNLARSLLEACPHQYPDEPAWIMLFRTEIDRLSEAGTLLIEAINAATK